MKIHLHLGVHKTATTWQQQTLRANAALLRDHQVAYLPLQQLRNWMTGRLMTLDAASFPFEDELRQRFHLAEGTQQVIVSDENLLGSCGEITRTGRVYGRAAARLTRLAELLDGHEVTVFLSFRQYADFLASAYWESLQGTEKYVPFQRFREKLDWDTASWTGLLATVRSTLSPTAIRVWRYEDFRPNAARVLQALAFELPQTPAWPESVERASPSQVSMDFLAHAAKTLGGEAASQLIEGLTQIAPRSAGFPAYDPWTPEERQREADRYARDLAGIPADLWLLPPGSGAAAR